MSPLPELSQWMIGLVLKEFTTLLPFGKSLHQHIVVPGIPDSELLQVQLWGDKSKSQWLYWGIGYPLSLDQSLMECLSSWAKLIMIMHCSVSPQSLSVPPWNKLFSEVSVPGKRRKAIEQERSRKYFQNKKVCIHWPQICGMCTDQFDHCCETSSFPLDATNKTNNKKKIIVFLTMIKM